MLLALLLVSAPVPPDVARHLVGGALTDGVAYARLRDLTDTIGPRLSGSPGAEAAVQWALKAFQQDGLAARREPVKVPHWVRGEESGEILPSPGIVGHRLALTALGNSVEEPVPARLRSIAVPEEPPQAAVTRARRTIRFMVRSFANTVDRPHSWQARPRHIVRALAHAPGLH